MARITGGAGMIRKLKRSINRKKKMKKKAREDFECITQYLLEHIHCSTPGFVVKLEEARNFNEKFQRWCKVE